MAIVPFRDERWEYARRDPTIRDPVPGPTYGTENPGCPLHYSSIPISTSPRSRPFRVFANCKPTPPRHGSLLFPQSSSSSSGTATSSTGRTTTTQATRETRSQSSEGLHASYAEISEGEMSSLHLEDSDNDAVHTDEAVHTDDDDVDHSNNEEMSEDAAPPPGIIRTFLDSMLEAAKAGFGRAKEVHIERQERFLFWADGACYRLKLRRQTLCIQIRLLLEQLGPILLRHLFFLVSCVVLFSMGLSLVTEWLGDDGLFEDEITYFLIDDCKGYCVAT
ncbi:hypothetical protein NPX13_g7522 [Xylaria arbuscula]|uniref:Uncharacterized protein n=1 Tax=Xylaria arbuscula TaxID=114810 RepID=A0A9W8N9U6_9PEZI|nr:hypothetical protein NPX13_g7522 [Xylaria arbuscula]